MTLFEVNMDVKMHAFFLCFESLKIPISVCFYPFWIVSDMSWLGPHLGDSCCVYFQRLLPKFPPFSVSIQGLFLEPPCLLLKTANFPTSASKIFQTHPAIPSPEPRDRWRPSGQRTPRSPGAVAFAPSCCEPAVGETVGRDRSDPKRNVDETWVKQKRIVVVEKGWKHWLNHRRKIRSQTSDNMDRWKAEQGRERRERVRRKKNTIAHKTRRVFVGW